MPDSYTVHARIIPAVLVILPALLLGVVAGLSPTAQGGFLSVAALAVALVGAGVARDRGIQIQAGLWAGWGGEPTLRLMRWAGKSSLAVRDRHQQMATLTGLELPDQRAEADDPEAADVSYRRAVRKLRVRFREDRHHQILADANAEYGMRRNCLGLKPIGIAVAGLVVLISLGLFVNSVGSTPELFAGAGGLSLLWGLGWYLRVNEAWVHTAAKRYGEHFFETVSKVT